MMERDSERLRRVVDSLREGGHDALVCSLPANVLMLTGYWPVIGNAVAVVTSEGRVSLLSPLDESDLTASGWADDVRTFEPGGLDELPNVGEAVVEPLTMLLDAIGLDNGGARVAFEGGSSIDPSSYVSMNIYGCAMRYLLAEALPNAALPIMSSERGRGRSMGRISSSRPGRGDITATLPLRKMASEIEWVISRTVLRDSCQMRCNSMFMVSRVSASSAPKGSSISSNAGS